MKLNHQQLTELFNTMVHPSKRVRGFKSREDAIRAIASVLQRTADSMDESELGVQYAALMKERRKGGSMARKAAVAEQEEETPAPKKSKIVKTAKSVSRQPDPDEEEEEEETEDEKPATKARKTRGPRRTKVDGDLLITVTVGKGAATFRPGSKQAERWDAFMENPPKGRTVAAYHAAGFSLSSLLWAKKKGWIDVDTDLEY